MANGAPAWMTVMLSSRNGAPVIGQTLDSMCRLHTPAGGWKLIVVDNGSADDTGEILRKYSNRLPLTILSEKRPGKNRALNLALKEAEGDLYIFCDDDVIAAANWLVKWQEVTNGRPGFDLFSGATEALWPCDPPAWILDEVDLGVVFAINPHMREGPCDAIAMFGTNMAIRASVFARGICFNEDIGPSSTQMYPMGSETELARRLAGLGYRCWFSEAPRVKHIIRAHQMQRQSMLVRAYRWGRGQAQMGLPHHYAPQILRRKNWLRRALYPVLMHGYRHREAWARQWEWAIDQGYEDCWREQNNLNPSLMHSRRAPVIARRFLTSRKSAG